MRASSIVQSGSSSGPSRQLRRPVRASHNPALVDQSTGAMSEVLTALLADAVHGAADLKNCLLKLIVTLEPLITPAEIQESVPETDHFDELSIASAMANLGYDSTHMKLAPVDIDPRLLPCLFIPDRTKAGGLQSPCVILAAEHQDDKWRIVLFDGATRESREIDVGALGFRQLGTGYFFRKRNAADLANAKQVLIDSGQSWFRAIAGRFTQVYWQLAVIGVLLNVVSLATPLFVMLVYDRVISPRSTDAMMMLTIGVGLAMCIELFLRVLRTRLLSWLTARIHFIVGSEVFKRLIELPPSIAQKVSVTAQISRLKSFEAVRDFFSGPIFVSTIEAPAMLIAIGLLVFVSPTLAAVPFASMFSFIGLFLIMRHFIATAIKVAATENSTVQKFCVDTFQDREEIRASSLAPVWQTKYREISGRANAAQARLQFLSAIGEHVAYALTVLTGIAALTVGVQQVWSGAITTGVLVGSMILIWRAVSPFYSLCTQVARFEQFRNSVRQINAVMSIETESEARKASVRVPHIVGKVEFQNVALRYSRDSGSVFMGLNTTIEPGEIVGICGAMGSGKSSVLRLVQALNQPHFGRISIDGFNLQQLSARDLRRQIGYLPQVAQAFPGTIAENLRFVRPGTPEGVLWQALEQVGAANRVRELANGIHQDLQAHVRDAELLHRIAFARIILQNARLVLLDELPGTLLNTGLGEVFADFISRVDGDKTVLFVSQRMDHLRRADKVIGLRHGRTPIVGNLDSVLEKTQ